MLKPVRNNILLEVPPKKKEEVSKGGIVMVTKEAPEELPFFIIAAKGIDCVTEASIGDRVLIGGNVYGLKKIPYEDKEYIIVSEESILAISNWFKVN